MELKIRHTHITLVRLSAAKVSLVQHTRIFKHISAGFIVLLCHMITWGVEIKTPDAMFRDSIGKLWLFLSVGRTMSALHLQWVIFEVLKGL